MKKIMSIVLSALLAFSLFACGESKSIDEQFMDSLAKGLEARWVLVDAEDEKEVITKEDWKGYFDAEYNEISKYKDEEFEDVNLEKWAKKYIDSIAASKDALRYFGTNQWESKYFSGVYHDRAEALYEINAITPVPVATERENELNEVLSDGEVSKMTEKIFSKVKFEKIKDEYGWKDYEAVVENTTSVDFSYFEFSVDLIDKEGVTVETALVNVQDWSSGEKAKFKFSTDEKFSKMDINHAQWYFE